MMGCYVRTVLLLMVLSWTALSASAEALQLAVVVDVSGSMRHNDPDHARLRALRLLLHLLPAASEVSLWRFAAHPQRLWSSTSWSAGQLPQALQSLQAIDEHGAWTDIDAALQVALQDLARRAAPRRHLVLLTDGYIELGQGPAADATSRARVWQQDLDLARRLGVHMHTLGLGGAADEPLLRHLALGSGGRFLAVDSHDLSAALMQILDVAAPAQHLPVQGRAFSVDDQVGAMTLLWLGRQRPVGHLIDPQGHRWSRQEHPASVLWENETDYELVEVRKPAAGVWHLDADLSGNDRLSVLSDLALQVTGLPANVAENSQPELDISLHDAHGVVLDSALLEHCRLRRDSGRPGQLLEQELLYDGPQQGSVMIPEDGHFKDTLPRQPQAGDTILRYTLQCGAFAREFDQVLHVTAHPGELPPPVSPSVAPKPAAQVAARHRALWPWLLGGLAALLLSALAAALAYVLWRKRSLRLAAAAEAQPHHEDEGPP